MHLCVLLKAQPWVDAIQSPAQQVSSEAAPPPAADGTATLATPAVMGVALLFPAGPALPWLRTDQVAAVRAVAVAEARPQAAAAGVASQAAAAFPPAQGDTQAAEPARVVAAAGTINR